MTLINPRRVTTAIHGLTRCAINIIRLGYWMPQPPNIASGDSHGCVIHCRGTQIPAEHKHFR